tara:strand:+ start:594 stop:959 length:366 start_codon:yes stop_codon:yes gene_type:complete
MNAKTQHMPGPWKIWYWDAGTEDLETDALGNGYTALIWEAPDASNHTLRAIRSSARVMEAAPDMLAALKSIVEAANPNRDGTFYEGHHIVGEAQSGQLVLKGSFLERLTNAVEAIAKAEDE